MRRISVATKAWVAGVLSGLGALELALIDDVLTRKELVHTITTAIIVGWGVYLAPNAGDTP